MKKRIERGIRKNRGKQESKHRWLRVKEYLGLIMPRNVDRYGDLYGANYRG